MGIELYCGSNKYNNTQILTDDNYFNILNADNIGYNINSNSNYFQTKDITNYIFNYLHTDIIRIKIINKNPFKDRYNNNNDVFIHIRLDDTARFNRGINYYLGVLSNITYDNIYISTDEPKHQIIIELINKYPNIQMIDYNEILTF